jgi:hypothetical protein
MLSRSDSEEDELTPLTRQPVQRLVSQSMEADGSRLDLTRPHPAEPVVAGFDPERARRAFAGRCINCKGMVFRSAPHVSDTCATVVHPFASLTSMGLQALRGKKTSKLASLQSTAAVPYLLVAVLAVHSFFTGASFGANTGSAVGLFVAILSHKWYGLQPRHLRHPLTRFAGFALGMSFRSSRISVWPAMRGVALFAAMYNRFPPASSSRPPPPRSPPGRLSACCSGRWRRAR